MKYLLPIIVIILSSCDGANDPAPLKRTQDSFDSPEKVATLPDGRVVKCVVRDMGSAYYYPHYIYFVDGVSTTTTNTTVQSGKTTYNQVTVEIDGVKYIPVPQEKNN